MEINLREYYQHCKLDEFTDIPDSVYAVLREYERAEAAYRMRVRRNKAYYSLDRGDGIENAAIVQEQDPLEILERKLMREQLYQALDTLPDKQARRVYAHFFLGMSKSDIARAEGVSEAVVRIAISKALKQMKKILEK